MNAELPLFNNGEHNSKSAPTIDRVITPLTTSWTGQADWAFNLTFTEEYSHIQERATL